jgi:hypothetical protein
MQLGVGKRIVSAITTFTSGQPINLSGPNQTGSPFINHLPNRVCDGRSEALAGNIRNNGFRWFDTSCFQVPPVGHFCNSGATVLSGPGLNNWDLGIGENVSDPRDVSSAVSRRAV